MKRLNRFQIVSLLMGFAGAALIMVSVTTRVTPQPANDQALSVARSWLLDSCDADEVSAVENQLRAAGPQLEAIFIQAFRNGPDAAFVSDVEQAAIKRYDSRQEYLNSGNNAGLSKEDLDAARSVSREQFVSQAKNDFVLRYKSQALLGLGIVDGEKAQEVLRAAARDENSPLKSTAEQALQKLTKRTDQPR